MKSTYGIWIRALVKIHRCVQIGAFHSKTTTCLQIAFDVLLRSNTIVN